MSAVDLAIIVTTYQMPRHLDRCLASIDAQQTARRLELIVADDGSLDETPQVVERFARQSKLPVRLVSHPHGGFHAARCRNEGARQASADRLLFVDGDCLLPPDHVEQHLSRAGQGIVTAGYCVRLDQATSERVTPRMVRDGHFVELAPPHELKALAAYHRKAWFYNLIGHRTKPALRSTDFSISRHDFESVNGFDEQFQGWGCEDDDLGRRLRAAGVRIQSVLDRTRVYHLWHPPAPSKPVRWREGQNVGYLERQVRPVRCRRGLVSSSGLQTEAA
jgi:glycosyltransferase involved in cell wall biosynthesis